MTEVAKAPDAAGADAVRPQDDLFRAVNGEWLATTEIPSDQSTYGAFLVLRDEAEAACRELVELPAEGESAGSPQQLISDLYTSFMDTRSG